MKGLCDMNYENYIGIKEIHAMPMTKTEYCRKYEIELPAIDANGYEVIDLDGCASWSPKKSFENDFKKLGNSTFSHALKMLKSGKRITRKDWNSKDTFLFLAKSEDLTACICGGNMPPCVDSICMKNAENRIIIGWIPTQTDLFAEDWEIIN